MTFKEALKRGLIGFPIGIFISMTISVITSILIRGYTGDIFSAAAPDFIQVAGSELNAVILQYFLSGVLGFSFAVASLIYEIDSWSITKQTVVHFLFTAGVFFPISYICHWFSFSQFVVSFVIFAVIYFLIWVIQYKYWKKKVKELNDKLAGK
jgi:hypothetical protein